MMDWFIALAKTPDGVVVNCKSTEESKAFLRMLECDLCHKEFCSRVSLVDTYHRIYGDKVCYHIKNLDLDTDAVDKYDFTWCDLDYYKRIPYLRIVSYSEVIAGNDLGDFDAPSPTMLSMFGLEV